MQQRKAKGDLFRPCVHLNYTRTFRLDSLIQVIQIVLRLFFLLEGSQVELRLCVPFWNAQIELHLYSPNGMAQIILFLGHYWREIQIVIVKFFLKNCVITMPYECLIKNECTQKIISLNYFHSISIVHIYNNTFIQHMNELSLNSHFYQAGLTNATFYFETFESRTYVLKSQTVCTKLKCKQGIYEIFSSVLNDEIMKLCCERTKRINKNLFTMKCFDGEQLNSEIMYENAHQCYIWNAHQITCLIFIHNIHNNYEEHLFNCELNNIIKLFKTKLHYYCSLIDEVDSILFSHEYKINKFMKIDIFIFNTRQFLGVCENKICDLFCLCSDVFRVILIEKYYLYLKYENE